MKIGGTQGLQIKACDLESVTVFNDSDAPGVGLITVFSPNVSRLAQLGSDLVDLWRKW